MWDFAGQEDYYQTHSLFISDRSPFLLVVDISAYCEEKHEAFVQRWLDIIRARVSNAGDVVLLLVLTHADLLTAAEVEERISAIIERVRDAYEREKVRMAKYRSQLEKAGMEGADAVAAQRRLLAVDDDLASDFKDGAMVQIAGHHVVSCKPPGAGFEALRDALVRIGNDHGYELPTNWSKLQETCDKVIRPPSAFFTAHLFINGRVPSQ